MTRICLGNRKTALFITAIVILALSSPCFAQGRNGAGKDPKTVRVCVIGGLTLVGLWPELAKRFEAKTDYTVKMIKTGPRVKISKPFRRGKADFLTMHAGDITTNLVADGYGINMRPWSRNDLIIAGPASDPAGIKGMKSGVEALVRIADTKSIFVDNRGNGPRELGKSLWRLSGVKPNGDWVVKCEAKNHMQKLSFAESVNGYIIFGRMPITYRKVKAGNMQIMVGDDPRMRRTYVLMEANPAVFPNTNYEGAQALSDFLLSEEIQKFMLEFGIEENGGKPPFYPVWPLSERLDL